MNKIQKSNSIEGNQDQLQRTQNPLMKNNLLKGVPHRVRFGVSFNQTLHMKAKKAAALERRSLSNWLEIAAQEFTGCATPKPKAPKPNS